MGELLKIVRIYITLAVIAAVGIVAYRILATYQWMRLPEDNPMMAPIVKPGDMFRVNKLDLSAFRRGDIVVFVQDPRDPAAFLLGRIVALPGERIAILSGEVRVNGERLAEEGVPTPTAGEVPEITVPRDHYYILVNQRGDPTFQNAPGKVDSRGLGPIPASRFLGKAVL